MAVKKLKLGVIGYGNMAQAICGGLVTAGLIQRRNIVVYDPYLAKNKTLLKKLGVQISLDYALFCKKVDVILLAVKPQSMPEVLPELAKSYRSQLIISVVTGVRINTYQKTLGAKVKVIRVMPNTPALIGYGAAAYFAHKNCSIQNKKLCETMLNCVGTATELKREALIDIVTALSGSGPAFVYTYAQAMIDKAVNLGLSQAVAKQLLLQTLLGATHMMLNSKESPAELTKKVTSKGGTTLAGLEALRKKGFTKAIEACMVSATQRALEMSQLFGK